MGEKSYKGFDPGMVCRGKKYTENTVFEEPTAEVCERGMHYCNNPFEVLNHYPLINDNGEFNEFAEVEDLAEPKTHDNKKFCTTKLRIGAKLSFAGFVKACVNFAIDRTKFEFPDSNICSGNYAQIGSSGDSAQIGSSGNYAQIGSSGDSARIGSSGDSAQIGSSGEDSVICCAGHDCRAKAKKGSWITLSEWRYDNGKERIVPACVKTEYVDGERIKEDTYYKLENGEFVEMEE